ncbi:MAG: hypothetical protein O2907_01040 [Proteobacteria bacterium]|nr:hypothetical protein [Pseudomonadota bacterium]MDA1062915.1 hypothetical protein [Pseudomonadota bacterium]
MRSMLLLMSVALLGLPAWAQEDGVSETTATEDATVETEPAVEPETTEEPVVDDVFYQDVDDKDFRPSEDIPADQSITFPSDI